MTRDSLEPNNTALRLATILFFAVVLLLLVNTNMRKELNHDEHMYVAAGELLAGWRILPYRDYPYLQMPNQALVFGVLLQATDHLLLAARLLNTLFGALLLGAIFYYTTGLFPASQGMAGWLVGAGSVVLVMANPLFLATSGLAMNHDLPVLLTTLAVIFYSRAGARRQSAMLWVLCGVLLGLAVGTRLSFLVALVSFSLAILFLTETTWRKGLYLLAMFSLGALLSLLPAVLLAALAPVDFLFDNWIYHQVNPAYWLQLGYSRAMDFPGKLAYLNSVAAVPGNLILLATFVVSVVIAGGRALLRRQWAFSLPELILALLLAFIIGALIPTPTWHQYYYVLVPLLVLGIAYAVSLLYNIGRWKGTDRALFALAVVASCIYGLPSYFGAAGVPAAGSWVPHDVHGIGIEIKQAVGEGKVATLAPLFPMEGGVRTYRELATGPFEWRISGFLTDRQQRELSVVSAGNLEAYFREDPPRGILTGIEVTLEGPLIEYAMRHGYTPTVLSNGATLWLR